MPHTEHIMEVEKGCCAHTKASLTYLHERHVAWQVKYASGKVLGIVLSMPPLNFSFRS